jgi:hypothetical protein
VKLLKRFVEIVTGILREIADESAYERHLRNRGLPHSKEEWRRFSDARLRAKYCRARCC